MNHAAQELLMRYVDGDLDDEQVAQVERWLTESAEARALLSDLEVVGDAVVAISEERGTRAGAITDAVMDRIAAEGGSRNRPAASPAATERRGRLHAAIPAIGLALAAAAAVAIYLRPHPALVTVVRERPLVTASAEPRPTVTSASSAEVAASDPDTGASIESVDFGAQNGTIFMVPSGAQVTPVVWLMDDAEPSSG